MSLGVQLNVVWLDVVTYLHHHGYEEKIPWYRGEVKHCQSCQCISLHAPKLDHQ
jgi:hypothetical protein